VAQMIGYGGAAPLAAQVFLKDGARLPGRLLVFKLGGKATAPAYKAPERAVADLTGVTSTGDAKRGFALYHQNCQVCHGPNASGNFLVSMRQSQMLTTADAFKSVVIDGALAERGMASFSRFLNAKDAEDIRAYILSEAHAAAADK